MKYQIFLLLAFLSLSSAQGIQGSVQLAGSTKVWTAGHTVELAWNRSADATSYNVYRASAHGGPYTLVKAGIVPTVYVDGQVKCKQTLYYVVTAVSGRGESGYSNEVVVSIP